MSANPKFHLWPLLDKEINRGIGRAGVVFTALFCVVACAVGYYFIRPWSMLREEDMRQLGYLGFVAIPLAAWLLGGLIAIQLFMAFQVLRWLQKKEVQISCGGFAWMGSGVLLVCVGTIVGFFVEPFYYGFIVAIAGCIILFRSTGSMWAWRVFYGITSFPP